MCVVGGEGGEGHVRKACSCCIGPSQRMPKMRTCMHACSGDYGSSYACIHAARMQFPTQLVPPAKRGVLKRPAGHSPIIILPHHHDLQPGFKRQLSNSRLVRRSLSILRLQSQKLHMHMP